MIFTGPMLILFLYNPEGLFSASHVNLPGIFHNSNLISMKKAILLSFLMAIFAITFSACSGGSSKLDKICNEAQAQLPQNLGNGMKMTNIAYENGNVVYTVECMEVTCGRNFISDLEENKEQTKEMMIANYLSNPQMKRMVNILKEENAGIEFQFKGKPSGKTAVIEIAPDEL